MIALCVHKFLPSFSVCSLLKRQANRGMMLLQT
jgi:hypothetical protein